MARVFSLLFLLLLATGCSTVERRISERPEVFEALPPKQQQLVQQGKIAEGMDQDAVYLAWGKPHEVLVSSSEGDVRELWNYYRLDRDYVHYPFPLHHYYRHPRHHFHHHPFHYDPYVTASELDKTAVFKEDRVVAWEASSLLY